MRGYFVLGVLLLILFVLPVKFIRQVRSGTIGLLTPLVASIPSPADQLAKENATLTIENQMLREQVERVYRWLAQVERLESPVFNGKESQQFVLAKVIFRDPASWSQYLWLDVGHRDNPPSGRPIIEKNSPVVSGSAVVGLIDYVGKHRCRVRLISDSGLTPSVRAVRGGMQQQFVMEHVFALMRILEASGDNYSQEIHLLEELKEKVHQGNMTHYLAKGYIAGMSEPLWRCLDQKLIGNGFQYGFDDEKGNSRELSSRDSATPLLQKGDLLVTTGFDGLFPEGLNVGVVSEVAAINPGDYAYAIKANLAAQNLNDIRYLHVIPSLK